MKSETERMEVIGVQNNFGHQKKFFYTKAIEELFFYPQKNLSLNSFLEKPFWTFSFVFHRRKQVTQVWNDMNVNNDRFIFLGELSL